MIIIIIIIIIIIYKIIEHTHDLLSGEIQTYTLLNVHGSHL